MRRILIVPSISSTSVTDSESLQELYALTEIPKILGKKAYFYMVVPPWVRDGLRGHDHLHYVHIDTTRDEAINDAVGYSAVDLATLFARRGGRYIVDAVVTDCVQFSLQLSRILSDPERERIPVIVRDLRRIFENKDEVEDNASVALGYSANYFSFTSSEHKMKVSGFLRTYLQPSLLRRFESRTLHWPLSMDLDKIDKLQKSKKAERITACFAGDPSHKRSKWAFSLYRQFYAMGVDVIVASRESRASLKRSLPDDDTSYLVDIHCGLTRDAYLSEIAKSHLFISVAENEYDVFEDVRKLLLGQIGIFPFIDNGMVAAVLGNQYPFYYKPWRKEEVTELSNWIVNHYNEAKSSIDETVKRCREIFSRKRVLEEVWGQIENIVSARYKTHTFKEEKGKKLSLPGSVKYVSNKLGNEFALQVFLDILEEHATWLKPWGHKGTLQILGNVHESLPTMYDLRELLDNLGWEDTCSSHEPMIKRRA